MQLYCIAPFRFPTRNTIGFINIIYFFFNLNKWSLKISYFYIVNILIFSSFAHTPFATALSRERAPHTHTLVVRSMSVKFWNVPRTIYHLVYDILLYYYTIPVVLHANYCGTEHRPRCCSLTRFSVWKKSNFFSFFFLYSPYISLRSVTPGYYNIFSIRTTIIIITIIIIIIVLTSRDNAV